MFKKFPKLIEKAETISYIGKIENIVGMCMESSGSRASIGDIAMVYNEETHKQIPVEVVGFKSKIKKSTVSKQYIPTIRQALKE